MSSTEVTIKSAIEIRPFHVEVAEEDLADLRRRIAATRWPSKELVSDRSQGVQLATLHELARYWTTDYDWRKAEAKLNVAPDHDARLARLGHRAARGRRPAHRPDRTRRKCRRRVRPRAAIHSRLRLLR